MGARVSGTRAVKIERVRRRLLEEAVADNVDTMRGLPPRAIRSSQRLSRIWVKRAPFLLLPLTLAASTYIASNGSATVEPLRIARATIIPPRLTKLRPTPKVEQPLQRVATAALQLSVRRVILDSGHGGNDAGATSAGLAEKDVTLDISRRLRQMLEVNGFEVIVTRPEDRTLALRDRALIANDSHGDIFVSIHVNSIVKHTSSYGVETYYLGPTNDPSLTKLAAAENSGSGYSMADLRKLLDGVYADARRDESHELADTVQRHLYGQLRNADSGLANWGVKRAPFVVLVATDMPAILAEVGCLSNQREATMLGEPLYRQRIAEALFHGIRAYASANDAPQKKGT